jgi:hypothetical protein
LGFEIHLNGEVKLALPAKDLEGPLHPQHKLLSNKNWDLATKMKEAAN